MKKLIVLMLLLPVLVMAQNKEDVGVKFERGISADNWDELFSRAKAQNKYVFIDCYTTWCGPCTLAKKQIFPQKIVGDFFNKYFVSFTLQFDENIKDDSETISLRPIANAFSTLYKVNAYPTFLIFDNTAKPIHKFVGVGDADFFIENGSAIFDTLKQYYYLQQQYEMGRRDIKFTNTFFKNFVAQERQNTDTYLKAYLNDNINYFTKENGELFSSIYFYSDSFVLAQLYQNKQQWVEVMGKQKVEKIIEQLIEQKLNKETIINRNYDDRWSLVAARYRNIYPDYFDKLLARIKVSTYILEDCPHKALKAYNALIKDYPNTDTTSTLLYTYSLQSFYNSENKKLLFKSLEWIKKCVRAYNESLKYQNLYANLLYKMGNKEEAIEEEKKVVNKTDSLNKKYYETILLKMQDNQPTWNIRQSKRR